MCQVFATLGQAEVFENFLWVLLFRLNPILDWKHPKEAKIKTRILTKISGFLFSENQSYLLSAKSKSSGWSLGICIKVIAIFFSTFPLK